MKARLIALSMCVALSCVACLPPSFLFTGRQPIKSEEKFLVLDGKCIVTLQYNANGSIADITAVSVDRDDASSCGVAEKKALIVEGNEILENSGSITLGVESHGVRGGGAGKMICYGPPVPSPPRCVCTAKPCPWQKK